MSTTYIPSDLRQSVRERADNFCEYCLLHEDDSHFGLQIDHIISEKHKGKTEIDNLALACAFCNRAKGSDIGSVVWATGKFVRFFNPRIDVWSDHFRLEGVRIVPNTDVGRTTEAILAFNTPDRLLERQAIADVGRYPLKPN